MVVAVTAVLEEMVYSQAERQPILAEVEAAVYLPQVQMQLQTQAEQAALAVAEAAALEQAVRLTAQAETVE